MICKQCTKEYSESRSNTVCNACLFKRNKIHAKHILKKREIAEGIKRKEESKIKQAHVTDIIFGDSPDETF